MVHNVTLQNSLVLRLLLQVISLLREPFGWWLISFSLSASVGLEVDTQGVLSVSVWIVLLLQWKVEVGSLEDRSHRCRAVEQCRVHIVGDLD